MVSMNRGSNGCRTRSLGCREGRTGERVHRRRTRTPVTPPTGRLFFSCIRTQHMKRADWLAGVAMLLAVASWGVLAALLGG